MLVENEMAEVAEAELAVRSLWARLRGLCYAPAVTLDDVDAIGEELHRVEAGLAAGRRGLQAMREGVG